MDPQKGQPASQCQWHTAPAVTGVSFGSLGSITFLVIDGVIKSDGYHEIVARSGGGYTASIGAVTHLLDADGNLISGRPEGQPSEDPGEPDDDEDEDEVEVEAPEVREAAERAPEQVPGGTGTSVSERVPRLPCPECRFVISLSLPELLTAPSFTCPRCQTTLNLLRGENPEQLRHVQSFYVAIKEHDRLD